MAKTTPARSSVPTAPVRFDGFADREARFFKALAKHQNREWFAAHKDEYEDGWLAPMKALLAEVRAELAPRYAHEEIAAPKVFRIYRDVRFSKDKAPYKTHIGGYLGIDGSAAGPGGAAALYLHVAADELFACAGQYMMDGEQLKRFRAAVVDPKHGKALTAILKPLTRAGFTIGSHDQLQRVPRVFLGSSLDCTLRTSRKRRRGADPPDERVRIEDDQRCMARPATTTGAASAAQ